MTKHYKLDAYEQEIEDNLDFSNVSEDSKKLKLKLIAAAKNHVKSKKSITLRISTQDLEAIKIKASKSGMPYQTYINCLLHADAINF